MVPTAGARATGTTSRRRHGPCRRRHAIATTSHSCRGPHHWCAPCRRRHAIATTSHSCRGPHRCGASNSSSPASGCSSPSTPSGTRCRCSSTANSSNPFVHVHLIIVVVVEYISVSFVCSQTGNQCGTSLAQRQPPPSKLSTGRRPSRAPVSVSLDISPE
ncbi:uncharacterized protein [Triticum aestivum]|uniref:uncharacterized protein isoform X3 n=1 Tax=Triticum aestivum TaxID=4565 RepID=UPI001D015AC3|nr:uncharacterized protein LOC123069858 isoform X3 [Triticum aestivum]